MCALHIVCVRVQTLVACRFPLERAVGRFGGAAALAANLLAGLISKFDVSKSCKARTDWLDSMEAGRSDSAFICEIPSSVSVSHEY